LCREELHDEQSHGCKAQRNDLKRGWKVDYSLFCACRYYNRLSTLLCLAIYYNRLSAVLCYVWRYYLQPAIRSALSVDITTDYPLYRLSTLLCLVTYCAQLSYALYSAWRNYTPLSAAVLCLSTLHSTIRSALSGDTTADYLRRSTLYGDATSDYPSYRLFALIGMAIYYKQLFDVHCSSLCIAILHPTICGAPLYLAILQATIQSTEYPLGSVWRSTNDHLL
jgi:hypothetical protein